jgi:predicted ATPase
LGPGARSSENTVTAAFAANTNLPARRAGLIGRATDIANIMSLMRESRLVTVTGAGGVGKSRVALAAGDALLEAFAAGVWFVELAPLARGSSVADAVARALGIEASPGTASIELLRAHLSKKSLVLILDNCEHLITEAAAAADALLRGCPQLRVLATSREPLRIAGERSYRLPSLRVPSAADSLALDAARGAAFASIELFRASAQAADHTFVLIDENIAFVAEICRRLDGIPLAIELAAARVNILPVSALATRVESHLRILGGGDRIALPRHQTMHALIDWSYELLEPPEQRLFERLSVFSGGCALPEAVAVYGDDSVDEVAVLDMLSSLVDKSLVGADATGPQPRYGLLQTFAQYGLEKLTARGDLELVARRHAQAYAHLAERLEIEYETAPIPSWFARAQNDVANWQTALHWALEARHDVLLGQRLVAAMRPVWMNFEGAQRWLRLARELIDERTPPTLAAALHYVTAFLNLHFGELEQTVADCRWISEVYEKLGDPVRVARLKTLEGLALVQLGRVAEGEPLLAAALPVAREHGQLPLVAYLLALAGMLCFTRGDTLNGRAKYSESLAIYESIGAERNAAVERLNLADAEFGCGNVDQAVQLATSSLIAVRQFGVKSDIAWGLINLATYSIAADSWTVAHEYAHESLKLMKETKNNSIYLVALQHVAAIAALAPRDVQRPARTLQAVRLIGYIDGCFTHLGYSRDSNEQREYDRVLAALRAAYADNALATHLADGATMNPDQAVELGLSI